MKTSTTALFFSKTGLNQQDMVNEGHGWVRNKYTDGCKSRYTVLLCI